MRKISLLSLLIVSLTVSAEAATRHQSYFTYDDGGTVVRGAEDDREIDARVNLPVFPGDEVRTTRRGRSEIRLADGTIIALDRMTTVRFRSIRNNYESDDEQTVVELGSGQTIVSVVSESKRDFRLDTDHATYLPARETIFSVDAYSSTNEEVSVHEGSVEVRTPDGSTRLRAGEKAKLDDQGVVDTVDLSRNEVDDFVRWYLRRAERNGRVASRYLDPSIGYASSDLDGYGSWVYVSDFGDWCWRPRVSAGWRPYYYGSWIRSPRGHLVWASDEPWGWAPYHYGRWSYSPGYGWVWLPGLGYSPAWVYWAYGPSYIGWVPAGWYDCYGPYYTWAYRPYARTGYGIGFGFYGHIRLSGIDLRPWTFVNPTVLVSNRIDRAALTTDAIRDRLSRHGDRAAIGGTPIRFTRNDLKDPVTTVGNIARRGIGSGTGKEGSGSSPDMTPFFRRDPGLSTALRDRIARSSRPAEPAAGGSVSNRGGSPQPTPSQSARPRDGGIVRRGLAESPDRRAAQPPRDLVGGSRPAASPEAPERDWRGRVGRGPIAKKDDEAPPSRVEPGEGGRSGSGTSREGGLKRGSDRSEPARESGAPAKPSWRERGSIRRGREPAEVSSGDAPVVRGEGVSRPSGDRPQSDVPRRIIDGIGGVRMTPRETQRERPSRPRSESEAARERAPQPPRERADPPRESPPKEAPKSNDGGSKSSNIKRD